MNEAATGEIAREAVLVLLQVSGPLMLISLAVGLGIVQSINIRQTRAEW